MAQNLTYPVFTWGTVDDLSANWTTVTGASITGSIGDPFGGTGASTITNNVGSGSLYRKKNVTYKRDGYQEATLFLKAGTAAASTVAFYDNTASAFRSVIVYNWTNGAPTGSFNRGSGGLYAPVSVGNGWWMARQYTNVSTATNQNWLIVYPSSEAVVSGSVSVFCQNSVLSGSPVYQGVADDQNSDDTVYAIAPSGVEDTWVVRNDNRLRGKIRWVPSKMTDTPAKYSGFYGYNESIGVNCGFKSMVAAGRNKTSLRFSPDSSNVASYVDSMLFEPMTDGWELEEDGTRSLTFGIRNASGSAYEGF